MRRLPPQSTVIPLAGLIALIQAAPLLAFDPLSGDFSKDDPRDVRVMAYNHAGNFISDPSADAEFNRILTAINPDIICFEEFSSGVSATTIANRLNTVLPQPGGWHVHLGLVAGTRNVICSRYPLSLTRTDTIPTSSTRGVTIALADLPDADYASDIYLMGVHLKCCGDPGGSEDASRQRSTDAMANWMGDARGVVRPSGNNIVLPADTPIIALGDFNFVGGPQPETTLRTGDIQNEGTFGPDVKGDWDNSDLLDVHPLDPFTADDFTWQGNGSFPPGRLDRFYVSDSVVMIANDFVLNTNTMSAPALAAAGLQSGDTLPNNTSDHLPIVTDFHVASAGCPDADGDGVCDPNDICPGGDDNVDTDGDGVPDFCDPCPVDNPDDSDGDGVCDSADICPGGDDNVDTDGDGVPDFCDPCPVDNPDDSDGDGVCDSADICPGGDDNVDTDGDGVPDFCDPCPIDNPDDSDGDGVCDSADICPGGDDNVDTDGDGIPDFCDTCASGAAADFDCDSDVDSFDFSVFVQCFGGAANPPAASCPPGVNADLDGDGDVDAIDFVMFSQSFTGSL